jgi:SAM-dependent methyltransferase
VSTYFDIDSHRSMVFDEVRNQAYEKAIRAVVGPGSVVLDLGAGLGIHGLLAAAAGAGKVILLDASPVVDLCSELARVNSVASRVQVVRQRIEDIEELEPVDVIVSVFTGNFLLTEDLLPLLFRVRDRFLKPGGVLIPDRARMQAALVSASAFHARHVARWSEPTLGIDFGPIRRFAANKLFYSSVAEIGAALLSRPAVLRELDFAQASIADCRCEVDFEVAQSGVCHGLLGWFDIQLGDAWLSTGPESEPTHWSAAFLPLDPPLDVTAGDRLTFALDRPEFGEWTWTMSGGCEVQRHSTFLGSLADLSHLKKIAPGHVPGLGRKGELALLVLTQLAAGKSVVEISALVRQGFPHWSVHDPQLEKRIRNLVAEWGADVG